MLHKNDPWLYDSQVSVQVHVKDLVFTVTFPYYNVIGLVCYKFMITRFKSARSYFCVLYLESPKVMQNRPDCEAK